MFLFGPNAGKCGPHNSEHGHFSGSVCVLVYPNSRLKAQIFVFKNRMLKFINSNI